MNYAADSIRRPSAARAEYISNRFGKVLRITEGGTQKLLARIPFDASQKVTVRVLRETLAAQGYTIDGSWRTLRSSHVALLNRAV